MPCFCVPIEDCEKIKELNEIENPEMIKVIKKQQKAWYNSEVKNRDYEYKKGKPEWMI